MWLNSLICGWPHSYHLDRKRDLSSIINAMINPWRMWRFSKASKNALHVSLRWMGVNKLIAILDKCIRWKLHGISRYRSWKMPLTTGKEHIHKTRSLWSLHQWSRKATSRHENWPSHYNQQGVSCALPNILTGYPSATECRGHWECHLTKPMPWLNTIARMFSGICKWRTGYEWVFSLKSRRIRQKMKLIRIAIFI